MTRPTWLAIGVAAAWAWFAAVAWAEPTQVVLVKRAGVTAYEEVAEDFGEHCRVRVHVISFGDDGRPPAFDEHDVVVTVGQEALDRVARTRARIIPTLAFHIPPELIGPPAAPHPEVVLKALPLATASPVRVIGMVYGPRATLVADARQAAERLGIRLIAERVASGPEAVRALRLLADKADALWVPGDPDVVTAQVFKYALRLQLERGLPLIAATRQQVHSGALLAADYSARELGRMAADLVNRYLEYGTLPAHPSQLEVLSGARITVNSAVARRLGGRLDELLRVGARLE